MSSSKRQRVLSHSNYGIDITLPEIMMSERGHGPIRLVHSEGRQDTQLHNVVF